MVRILTDGSASLIIDCEPARRKSLMSFASLLVIILFFALLGVLPNWPYSRDWGYGPAGIVALLLALVFYLVIEGRL